MFLHLTERDKAAALQVIAGFDYAVSAEFAWEQQLPTPRQAYSYRVRVAGTRLVFPSFSASYAGLSLTRHLGTWQFLAERSELILGWQERGMR